MAQLESYWLSSHATLKLLKTPSARRARFLCTRTRSKHINKSGCKLKGHALLPRDGRRYAYRLTDKGVQVALLFLFFHQRLCGPLANSRFHHHPDPQPQPDRKLEAAYHKADKAIQHVVDLLAVA